MTSLILFAAADGPLPDSGEPNGDKEPKKKPKKVYPPRQSLTLTPVLQKRIRMAAAWRNQTAPRFVRHAIERAIRRVEHERRKAEDNDKAD